jgi:hypothetical protein
MGAVAVYDLSRSAGWAVWTPELARPRSGILKLPPPRTNGSVGPALKLLFEHISWVDRTFGRIEHLGYEAFIAATGGKKDDSTTFVTSPKTQKTLIGFVGVAELCAEILDQAAYDDGRGSVESHSIHNMSWRRFWLGAHPRGTKREEWKRLSVQKAARLGWDVRGDDEADALGQLHQLLNKLKIQPQWQAEIDRVDGLLGL